MTSRCGGIDREKTGKMGQRSSVKKQHDTSVDSDSSEHKPRGGRRIWSKIRGKPTSRQVVQEKRESRFVVPVVTTPPGFEPHAVWAHQYSQSQSNMSPHTTRDKKDIVYANLAEPLWSHKRQLLLQQPHPHSKERSVFRGELLGP